jgi:hypothetical protein
MYTHLPRVVVADTLRRPSCRRFQLQRRYHRRYRRRVNDDDDDDDVYLKYGRAPPPPPHRTTSKTSSTKTPSASFARRCAAKQLPGFVSRRKKHPLRRTAGARVYPRSVLRTATSYRLQKPYVNFAKSLGSRRSLWETFPRSFACATSEAKWIGTSTQSCTTHRSGSACLP